MKKLSLKKWIASALVLGMMTTSIFPSSVFAEEVQEQPVVEEQPVVIEQTVENTTEREVSVANTVLLISDTVPDDDGGAIIADIMAGAIKYTYENEDMAKEAFEKFIFLGYQAEMDASVDIIEDEGAATEEVKNEEIPVVEDELADEVEVDNRKEVLVAIIDTGLDVTNQVLKGRISDKTEEEMRDENGHGTLMAEIVASQTSENVKLLPIKAFDENGVSTVGSVYAAMMEAIYSGANVINLSVSGLGTSRLLTKAISMAKENNVAVVVSAGNDGSNVAGYMPGNIDDAITVSSTDEKKAFATYSNYGEKIDFSAMGTIIKDDEYYEGTSIACAYVSGYIAYILDNNDKANVYDCLKASAEDIGDRDKDAYFGWGYLTREHIVYDLDGSKTEGTGDKIQDENQDKNDSDISDEETSDELKTQRNITASTTWNLTSGKSLTDGYKICTGVTLVINGNGNGYTNNIHKSHLPSNVMFYIAPGGRLIMNSVWLNCNADYADSINASRSGVSVNQGGYLEMNGCDVFGSVSGGHGVMASQPAGDGAENYSPQTVILRNTSFHDCHDAIVAATPVYAEGCTIRNNTIGMEAYAYSSSLAGCNIYGNNEGIRNSGASVNVSGCSITSNNNGCTAHSSTSFSNCTIASNTNGLCSYGGIHSFSGITAYGNTRAIHNEGGQIDIYSGNYYSNGESAISNYAGTLNLGAAQVYANPTGVNNNGTAYMTGTSIHSNHRGIHNTGTLVMYSGSVFSNAEIGIVNAKTLAMSGGAIYGNTIGLRNDAGYTNITSGSIYNSGRMNVDVYDGTIDFRGGNILYSGVGYPGVQIENVGTSTFNQFANIGTNSYCGVRNSAQGINRYNVYNGATSAVGSDGKDIGVFLDEGASMTIHQPLKEDVKVASYDRYTGKVIVNCANEAIAQSAQQHLKLTNNASFQKTTLNTRKYADDYADIKNAFGYNYELLWTHYNLHGRNEGRHNDDANKTVVYRKGNGTTGAKTQVIVSQIEDTSFDENLAANGLTNEKFSAKVRTSDEFTGHKNAKWRNYVTTYWGEYNSSRAESIVYFDGEDVSKAIYNTGWASTRTGTKEHNRILNTYACWYPTTLYAKYDTGYDPNANHNDLDDPSSDDGTDDILDADPQAPEIVPCDPDEPDTPKPQGYSYFMNGNNQDKGKNYTVRHVSSSYQMPNNEPFEKDKCSGQGWSVLPTATYMDEEEPTKCRKEGETADTLMLLNALLERDDCQVVYGNGNFTITQYVVWDHFPTITAKDVAIASYWLDTKTETEIKEHILKNVVGKDTEDGILTNNKEGIKGVIISDFDMDELRAFESTGSVSITFKATDGVGNETEKMVRLWVNSNNPVEGAYPNRARCINKRFYDAGKVSVGLDENDPHYLDGYKQGGLMPTDAWYTNEEYAKIIEEAFANLENENWEFVWKFTHEQVLETQDFIEEHGFGDSEEDGALMAYYNKYKGNITTNKLPKYCDRTKHDYVDVTCTRAAYCKKCGKVWGKPQHDYYREIGANQEICTRCGDVKE